MAVKIEKKGKTFAQPSPAELIEGTEGPSTIEEKQIVANTSVVNKSLNTEDNSTEVIGVVQSVKPLCNVGVNAKQTINTGNYSSVSVGVSINVPCEFEDIETTYLYAKNFVDTKMLELSNEVIGES